MQPQSARCDAAGPEPTAWCGAVADAAPADDLVHAVLCAALEHRAVLGVEATLSMLDGGSVTRLVIVEGLERTGQACMRCGGLSAGSHRCVVCGGATVPVDDLLARAAALADARGVPVERVTGEAAATLLAFGGMGAWTDR